MDFKELAASILANVGGKENVDKVVHCATRLRFTLKDETKAQTDALKKTKGVLSVINAGGQYQVVIGPDVPQVYQQVIALGGFESAAPVEDEKAAKEDHRSKLSQVLESIASIFQPIIPAITGAGLLKAFMALFVTLGWLDNTTQTYTILNAFADSAFYFLPILLGASAARSFKCNQYVAMALGGVLLYPQFITLLGGEEAVHLFGLPVTQASYSSSVAPILLGVWFMSIVEHFVQKISPQAIKFFSVPLASIFVAGTVTVIVLGPIGTWIGDLIAAMVGGGVGGLYLGITGVGRYASGSPGLLVLPAYIGGDGMGNFINACIGTVIAMVVSFIVCFMLYTVWQKQGKLDESETNA